MMGVMAGGPSTAMSAMPEGLPGEEVRELAHALAQIAVDDPLGAAELGGALGLSAVSPPVASTAASRPTGGSSIFDMLGPDPSDDFDVDVTFTVAVVGRRGVGKTSLIRRFARGAFPEEYRKTLVSEFMEKRARVSAASSGNSEEVTFHIWDTPGGEDARSLAQGSCKRAKAYLVAFSAEDRASFEAVQGLVASVREVCGADVIVVLVQTKRDLAPCGAEPQVPDVEVESLAKQLGVRLCLSSARDGTGAQEAFEAVAAALLLQESEAVERFRNGEARGGLQWGAPDLPNGAAWAERQGAASAATLAPLGAAANEQGTEEEEELPLP
mmetsp:Transcript_10880/g.17353  ORF Transcript_10880/g.17353 Transcript_10880/m.17353 type:complete len:327 (+) Transcript_10880:87-1067(+)